MSLRVSSGDIAESACGNSLSRRPEPLADGRVASLATRRAGDWPFFPPLAATELVNRQQVTAKTLRRRVRFVSRRANCPVATRPWETD